MPKLENNSSFTGMWLEYGSNAPKGCFKHYEFFYWNNNIPSPGLQDKRASPVCKSNTLASKHNCGN